MVNVIVSQSDTESGVRFVLASTGQKLADRRIRPYVTLHGHSHGGGPHGLSPCFVSILWQGNGTVFLVIDSHVHVLKIGAMDNPPYSFSHFGVHPVSFLKRLAASASLGFEPGTFGSKVLSLTHLATKAARFHPFKLRVFLSCLCYYCPSLGFA